VRKLAFLVVGSAVWLLLGAVPASADNGPHMSTAGTVTDRCAGCHRLHTAKAAYVLVEEEPALCYTCHGNAAGGSALAVTAGLGYSDSDHAAPSGALRGGGFEYALIDAGAPVFAISDEPTRLVLTSGSIPVGASEPTTSAHSVDESSQLAWGGGAFNASANYGTANMKMTCTSCHDPHGGSNTAGTTAFAKQTYRILKTNPAGLGALTPTCTLSTTAAGGTCTVIVTPETTPGTGEKVVCTVAGTTTTCVSTSVSAAPQIPPAATPTTTPLYPSCTVPTVTTASVCRPGSQLVVSDLAAGTQQYTTTDYWQNLADNGISRAPLAPSTAGSSSPYATFLTSMSNWCSACHTRYRATSGKTYAYNTGDAVTTYRHRGDSSSRVQSAFDATAIPAAAGNYKASPNCIQCHVSHGANSATGSISSTMENPGGGTAGLGVGASPASADNRLLRIDQRGVCEQCHSK